MKIDKPFWIIVGGIIVARLLLKPATRAIWGAYTGPKFYADLANDIRSNDPAKIKHLHDSYNEWPRDVQDNFNSTLKKLGLRRPW